MAKKILSIQSHVIHGYVGNKAATFPLQYRGWDVDALNTVQFSNHPGYGNFTGFQSKGEELQEILEKGLIKALNIQYEAILTGYLPDIDGLNRIGATLSNLVEKNPKLKWFLDPVLGDNGKLYVSEGIILAYKKILKTSGVYLTLPNQFEFEILTNVKIVNIQSLKHAFKEFHRLYPTIPYIIVTSILFPGLQNVYLCACSDHNESYYFEIPRINALFSGSGDLFSALILDSILHETNDLVTSLNKTLSVVDNILKRTYELTSKDSSEEVIYIKDMKLIESRDLLRGNIEPKFTPQRF